MKCLFENCNIEGEHYHKATASYNSEFNYDKFMALAEQQRAKSLIKFWFCVSVIIVILIIFLVALK